MGLVCLLAVLLLLCRSSLCVHPENVLSLWCFYRESLLLRRYLLVSRMLVEFVPFSPLWMESKALVKSTNSNVACRFFARPPTRILRIVNIRVVVDLFLRKLFWFFLSMLLILGSILIFLSTESNSSRVYGPSLFSHCLQIILVIGSCVTFGGFPSRFSKCCFHSFIPSCWFVAFNLALAVLFLLLTSSIFYHA